MGLLWRGITWSLWRLGCCEALLLPLKEMLLLLLPIEMLLLFLLVPMEMLVLEMSDVEGCMLECWCCESLLQVLLESSVEQNVEL